MLYTGCKKLWPGFCSLTSSKSGWAIWGRPLNIVGLPKNDVFLVVFNNFLQVIYALEPHHFQLAAGIAHLGHEALFGPLSYHFPTPQHSLHLHVGQLIVQVHDIVKLRAVEVAEGVALNQVAVGEQAQLFAQQLPPLRPYPRRFSSLV